jgi:hypothetical protein
MSAWAWPQWVMAVFIAFLLLCKIIPSRDETRGIDILIWVGAAWVLWMGGFWS